jgi:hypothetical protein
MSWLFDYHAELAELGAGALEPTLHELDVVGPMLAAYERAMLATIVEWCGARRCPPAAR